MEKENFIQTNVISQQLYCHSLHEHQRSVAVVGKGETTVERLQTGTQPGEVQNRLLPQQSETPTAL